MSFERRVLAAIGVLIIGCLILALATWLQGTRVRSASLDVVKVTQRANERLLLQLNQATGAVTAKQVTITPSASFTATGGGKTIGIQFTQPLRNNTHYTINIKSTAGRTTSYAFTTGPASFYYVVDVTGGSQIHKRQLGGDGKDTMILETDTIQDYVVAGDTIVYIAENAKGDQAVRLYNVVNYEHHELPLPEKGMVNALSAATDGGSFGFIFYPSDYRSDRSNTLLTYKFSDPTLRPVAGFDNKPLKTQEWQFAKNGTTIAVIDINSILMLINPDKPPVPFGQFGSIEGFTYDDSGLIVGDRLAMKQVLDFKTSDLSELPKLPENNYILTATPLNTESGSVYRVESYSGTRSSSQLIIVNRQSSKKQIYSAANDAGYLAFNVLSPNDQYVAVQLQDNNTEQTTLKVIDTFTGKKIVQVRGAKVRW